NRAGTPPGTRARHAPGPRRTRRRRAAARAPAPGHHSHRHQRDSRLLGYARPPRPRGMPSTVDVTRSCKQMARSELHPESALPVGVGAQGPQEVDLTEAGPVDVAEVELGVGALPEQEVREA